MTTMRTGFGLALLLLAACEPASKPAAPAPAVTAPTPAAPAPAAAAALVGRWTGPEGLYLEIAADGAGGYTVKNRWSLDDEGEFSGRAATDGIVVERGGKMVLLRPGTGDETGMKYLQGKRDCIVGDPGEGYCR